MKIIQEFYQRVAPVSNRRRILPHFIFVLLSGGISFFLFSPEGSYTPMMNAIAAEEEMHLYIPEKVTAGNEIPVRIVFDHHPPAKEFWRLVVDVDGKPVALADLSLGRETVVNVPSPTPGIHKMDVLWKNPPGGKPLLIQRSVTITGSGTAGRQDAQPDQKNPHN